MVVTRDYQENVEFSPTKTARKVNYWFEKATKIVIFRSQ